MADVTISSSSSGKSSSHSSNSAPYSSDTPSTCSTQDVVDGDVEEEEEACPQTPPPWGRLLSMNSSYQMFDLIKDSSIAGRDVQCDYIFRKNDFKDSEQFISLSNKHFRIYREPREGSADFCVYIQDLSSNGTFINEEKIGKNLIRVLNDGDEVSLVLKKRKVFIFQDLVSAEVQRRTLPEEMQAKYILSKVLGSGACGEVKLAFRKDTCKKVAVKIISKKNFSMSKNKLKSSMMEEVNILRKLDHPCIVKVEDVFDADDALYIVLELVEGGELFERVIAVKRFPEQVAKLLFYQMLVAVQYLHDKGITHRDLKPENVLLASKENETRIKLTDFGLSRFVGENSLMKTLCGTPNYVAPEVLKTCGLAGYDKMVDCWSLGCMLFICLGGYPPFSSDYVGKTIDQQIMHGDYSFPTNLWDCVSKQAMDLIKKLLTVDPKERYSVADALAHPWLQDSSMREKADSLMFGSPLSTMQPPADGPVAKKPRIAS